MMVLSLISIPKYSRVRPRAYTPSLWLHDGFYGDALGRVQQIAV
jgi:hypothetical protein